MTDLEIILRALDKTIAELHKPPCGEVAQLLATTLRLLRIEIEHGRARR